MCLSHKQLVSGNVLTSFLTFSTSDMFVLCVGVDGQGSPNTCCIGLPELDHMLSEDNRTSDIYFLSYQLS